MKVIMLALMLFASTVQAQKLKVNEKDDMTGDLVKRTSSNWIKASMTQAASLYMEKINNDVFLHVTYEKSASNTWGVQNNFAVLKNALVIIKLSNDSLVRLVNEKDVVACKGCSGKAMSATPGVNLNLAISGVNVAKLSSNSLRTIRLYIDDQKNDKGYVEFEISEYDEDFIKNCLKLFE